MYCRRSDRSRSLIEPGRRGLSLIYRVNLGCGDLQPSQIAAPDSGVRDAKIFFDTGSEPADHFKRQKRRPAGYGSSAYGGVSKAWLQIPKIEPVLVTVELRRLLLDLPPCNNVSPVGPWWVQFGPQLGDAFRSCPENACPARLVDPSEGGSDGVSFIGSAAADAFSTPLQSSMKPGVVHLKYPSAVLRPKAVVEPQIGGSLTRGKRLSRSDALSEGMPAREVPAGNKTIPSYRFLPELHPQRPS